VGRHMGGREGTQTSRRRQQASCRKPGLWLVEQLACCAQEPATSQVQIISMHECCVDANSVCRQACGNQAQSDTCCPTGQPPGLFLDLLAMLFASDLSLAMMELILSSMRLLSAGWKFVASICGEASPRH